MPVPQERASGIAPCALLFIGLASPASAGQKPKAPAAPPAVDPYTEADPARLEVLGYRSLGPFRFGATTNELVQARLGDVPILWVETEHFRLGSTLAEYRPGTPQEIAALDRELDALRAALPRGADVFSGAKARKLDAWLRLHLFARRLERLHADFRARLGVLERPGSEPSPAFTGDELAVLLTHKTSTLARFAREFCGQEGADILYHQFQEPRAFFFGLSGESFMTTDSDMHYAVVYVATQNLLYDVNGFPHDLPAWWMTGVALWFARAAEPRSMLFSRPVGEALPPDELADWEPLVRGRVAVDACIGWPEMLARASWSEQPFGDNIVLWSRIDFLLRARGAGPELVRGLHSPEPTAPDSLVVLQRATGLELAALDAAWREWVTKTYRKKRG